VKLTVFVQDRPVATLASTDGFEHVVSYHPDVPPEDFISLLMPVRTKSYDWPDLHPFFRMNLPEGFLLSILQEQLGPHVGASPLSLLRVVGRNVIGRVKVASEGADPTSPPVAFELADILKGDNSEEAFVELVRRFAVSGVSGVVPKFLAPDALAAYRKGTLPTDRYIIKGSTSRLPGVALNEHLCMEVARRAGIETAGTQVSEDGQALVVSRFDYVGNSAERLGMEDLCSLLGLRPEQKYEPTWEQVVNRIKQLVPPEGQQTALERVADLVLLTYALRNADCHTKNVALLYSGSQDVRLAPVYDMLTITVYDDYSRNPPGLAINGRKTWTPGTSLELFLTTRCNLKLARVQQRIEALCEAMVEVAPRVAQASRDYPAFKDIGPRMLHAWNDGMNSLRLRRTWSLPNLAACIEAEGFAGIAKPKSPPKEKLGRSQLLAPR
jgi:serine/threonine-protein kinase HipA